MKMRLPHALLTALATVLIAGAASAQAAEINVSTTGVDNGTCGPAAAPCATLKHVLDTRVTAAPDTIKLGAGEFPTPGVMVNGNAAGDTIEGAGSGGLPGGTQLKHSNIGTDGQLQVVVPITVRSLQIKVPLGAGATRHGLAISNTAANSRFEDIAILTENGSTAMAVVVNASAPGVVFDRIRTTGNHVNDGMNLHVVTGNVVHDSNLRGGPANIANALSMDGGDVTVRRTRLSRDFAVPGLDPVIEALNTQLTVESSLITGGRVGINFQAQPGTSAHLTLRSSTIDIAVAGAADAPPDRHPIYVRTTMPGAGSATARVERSIFVEPVYTFAEAGSTTKVDCLDSIVPLAETATIACGAANGNLASTPEQVFLNAAAGDFHLKPGSPAVDGASAAVAAGESATDLDGNPRVLDGNRDCLARIDRGAYELTGQAADPATCTPPVVNPPVVNPPVVNVAPVLDRVSFLRTTFRTKAVRRAPKGTTVRFRLSEKAAVTMTVERILPGRRVGTSCRAPSRGNRGRRQCSRYIRVGTVPFNGGTGTNSKVWSGKVARRALGLGAYRARLVARDAAGKKSAEKRVSFRIVR